MSAYAQIAISSVLHRSKIISDVPEPDVNLPSSGFRSRTKPQEASTFHSGVQHAAARAGPYSSSTFMIGGQIRVKPSHPPI